MPKLQQVRAEGIGCVEVVIGGIRDVVPIFEWYNRRANEAFAAIVAEARALACRADITWYGDIERFYNALTGNESNLVHYLRDVAARPPDIATNASEAGGNRRV